MAEPRKKGLGKGLSALISSDAYLATAVQPSPQPMGEQVLQLDPHSIKPNPQQPRNHFDEEALAELAESIRKDGVQEPVIVRQHNGQHQLVSGERRVRAAIMADLETIPALLRHVDDRDMLRLGLIENIQREDLNPIDLAAAYDALMTEFDWTQDKLAEEVGKKRVTITNMLRLLKLPDSVQDRVREGLISMGHARALLALEGADTQVAACRKIIAEGLSVRQTENLGSAPKTAQKTPRKTAQKDPNLAAIEDELRKSLGTRVTLRANTEKSGRIEIEYYTLDQLDHLLDILRS